MPTIKSFLTCEGADSNKVPLDDTNLIVRAALLLRKQTGGDNRGANIKLLKRIPVRAGLGGGSSNAAVALLGLARLWKLEIGLKDLAEISAQLGADVPFFFFGGTVIGRGRGERLEALSDVSPKHLIVVMPEAEVATSEAYAKLHRPFLTKPQAAAILSGLHRKSNDFTFFESTQGSELNGNLHNDFESVVMEIHSLIAQAKENLLKQGAQAALLSGSGASVFGVFETQSARDKSYQVLVDNAAARHSPRSRVFSCDTLSRSEYRRRLNLQNCDK